MDAGLVVCSRSVAGVVGSSMGGSGSAGMGSMVCGGGACSVVIGRGTGLEVGSLLSLHEASSMIVEMRMMSGFECMAVCLNAEPMTCLVCGTPRKKGAGPRLLQRPRQGRARKRMADAPAGARLMLLLHFKDRSPGWRFL